MATKKQDAPKEKPQPTTVKMVKDGKPADVHPAEVDNYKAGGYELVK